MFNNNGVKTKFIKVYINQVSQNNNQYKKSGMHINHTSVSLTITKQQSIYTPQ